PFVLSPTTRGCVAAAAGLTCALTVKRVPVGANTGVQIKTYGNTAGTGTPLAIGLLEARVDTKKATQFSPAMPGAARRFVLAAADASFTIGQYANETFVLAAVDALGETIPSISVVQTNGVPVPAASIVYSGFSKGRLINTSIRNGDPRPTLFACCGNLPATFPYDGLQSEPETFTVIATGLPKTTLVMHAVQGNQSFATLLVANARADQFNPTQGFQMFPLTATGNVEPARSVMLRVPGSVFGEDPQGNFWSNATHYGNLGQLLGSLRWPSSRVGVARDATGNIYAEQAFPPCGIFEYPANRYGSVQPIRRIDFTCPAPHGAWPQSITVDAAGDVFIALVPGAGWIDRSAPTLVEYAAGGGSGPIAPTQTIPLPPITQTPDGYSVPSIDADAEGNLYVLESVEAASSSGGSMITNVYEIAHEQSVATLVLGNVVNAAKLSVDDAGDIYAWINAVDATTPDEIDVYPAGATTPVQQLGGSATGLSVPGQIAVPRAWVASARRRVGSIKR
ncbi:MAG TPA: hypothetical protein VK760_01295, partial [Candidatus Acidoferrales bacterium]|nr:hypothetical protein [Candidatus Acidoferrales bacterium]